MRKTKRDTPTVRRKSSTDDSSNDPSNEVSMENDGYNDKGKSVEFRYYLQKQLSRIQEVSEDESSIISRLNMRNFTPNGDRLGLPGSKAGAPKERPEELKEEEDTHNIITAQL